MNSQRGQYVTPVLAALLLWIASAPDSFAQRSGTRPPAHGAAGHSGHSHARFTAHHRARTFPRTAYWAAPLAYGPAYYAPTYAPTYASPPAGPSLYFVAPLSPNAPLFSFDGSPAVEPDWGWQRVNLAHLAAEVRAKREANGKP
jgi:hypothetical protein